MRNRQRSGAALTLLAGAPLLLGTAPLAEAELTVAVTELRSAKGLVHVCLTPDPKDFPDCDQQPKDHQRSVPAKNGLTVAFSGLEPGRYAIALLHDENGNGKIDRALLVPKEGFGFSRDAKVRMGPPRFDAAAFELKRGSNRQSIRVRYIL